MAMDTEFVSEGRYIPELSLVQLAWGEPEAPQAAVIDFLEVGLDGLAPILQLLERTDVDTVAHSARQDIGLLVARFGVAPKSFVDTQIAAMFAGIGEQIGYGSLVSSLLGLSLDKSAQFTDWLARPVSRKKLRYAFSDVVHLPRVWAHLHRRLRERGRLSWTREESQLMADEVKGPAAPEDAFREVKGWRGLRPAQLVLLRTLAGWRQREALDNNLPLSWILPDRAMIELCRARNPSSRTLRSIRGIGDGTVRRYGAAILGQLANASGEPPSVERSRKPSLTPRGTLWAAILQTVVQSRCLQEEIPSHLVARKLDAEAVADWHDRGAQGPEPEVALLTGWRRELAGQLALSWLRGQVQITASTDDSGVALRELLD